MRLEERIGALVAELDEMTVRGDAEYLRSGWLFAARDGTDVVEIRLGSDIAEAAMRTPDSGPSARGDEWVRFAPQTWDKMATDRLESWFRVAWRLAGGASAKGGR